MKKRTQSSIIVGDFVRKRSTMEPVEVLAFARMEKTGEDVVVYQNERNGGIFVVNRDEFMDGRYIKS